MQPMDPGSLHRWRENQRDCEHLDEKIATWILPIHSMVAKSIEVCVMLVNRILQDASYRLYLGDG